MTIKREKNTPELEFRIAEPADIDNIVDLVESAYRGTKSRQGWTTEADFIDGQRTDRLEVSTLMQTTDSVFILAFAANKLIASLQLKKDQNTCYLGMFAVSPQLQGTGIGRQLLQEAEHYAARTWQSESICMIVITIRSELIDWYLRQDYKKTGVYKPFPYNEPRYGKPNRDDLQLEVLEKKLL